MNRARIATGLTLSILVAALAGAAAPAVGATTASIQFADLSPVTATFGSDWYTSAVVRMPIEGGSIPVPSAQGTVDVFVQGIAEPWATGLPIAADGSVYIAQPVAQPLLPAGTHNITATFVPSAGGYLAGSQTSTPIQVTITPYTLAGTIDVVSEPGATYPTVRGSLDGSWVDEMRGSPAGTWTFSVADPEGEPVFGAEVPVAQGQTGPTALELAAVFEPDQTYTVSGTFSPVAEIAGGLTVEDVADVAYSRPGAIGLEGFAVPIWALVVVGVVLVGLIVANIVVITRIRRRPGRELTAPLAELES